jgi:PAN domain
MRALVLCFAVVITTVISIAGSIAPAAAQLGYDRPGGDYASAAVASGDPAVCAARCEHDRRCRAWAFSYPTSADEPAMCWLKHEIVPAVKASCCVSGVRGAGVIEPRAGDLEFSIDRYGGDYRSFETKPDPKAAACADACKAENRCRAFTYRRPGYGVTVAHCYLKDTIKPPRHRPCCISGVVR